MQTNVSLHRSLHGLIISKQTEIFRCKMPWKWRAFLFCRN